MSEDDMQRDFDAAEIQELTAIARSLRTDDFQLDPVPDDVWAGIADTIRAEAGTNVIAPPAHSQASTRWFQRSKTMMAVAAAAVIAVVAVAVFSTRGGDDTTVVAVSDLDSLADGFAGSAELEQTDDGYRIDLDLAALPDADGYYELWLIKSLETGEMQSLGFIDGSGEVALPPGLDPAEYATVDISIEPLDGIPTHSGNSVLRGTLQG